MEVKDCNGNILTEEDSVLVTKDLKVGGSSMKLKRGEKIKKIRFGDDAPESIECRIGKATIVLKTCFLKKA